MSEAASEADPETLVNCEQQDAPAAGEEQTSSVALQDESTEDSGTAEKDVQAKVQSVFEQVRTRIRSQASKSSILELVQKIKERESEILQETRKADSADVDAEEEKEAEKQKDGSTKELDLRLEMLCSTFEDKLEATKRDLKNEFDVQISLVRKDMQTYTDQALKDLEQKMQEWRSHDLQQTHPKTQAEGAAAEKKQKPSATPLALRRGKVLTRTMTTIIPKTSAPVLTGPRAKSEEILSISKGHSPPQFMLRDQVFYLPEKKPYQSRNPLPPARPPVHQRKKPAQTKAKTGIEL